MSDAVGPLVDSELAARVLERALARGGDFAELFCEERRGFTLSIDESRIERPQSGRERGAGIRVIDGEVTRFAHVDGLGEDDLMRAADGLASALAGDATQPLALKAASSPELQEIEVDPASVPAERKAEVLRELDERARSAGAEVAQAIGQLQRGTPPRGGLQLGGSAGGRRSHPGAARRAGRGAPGRDGRDRLRDAR